MSRKVPILAYHKVGDEALTRFWVGAASFDAQMAALREHGFEAVSLQALWLSGHGGPELPDKPVCITFDDGYENFALLAFPILRKHGLTASVFLPTTFIGDSRRHANDWDRSLEERSFRAEHLLWAEVLELKRQGIEFGAHTKTHQDLASLFREAPLDAAAEIIESKKEIEERLFCEVGFFSYPYTASGSEVEAIVREAGFLGAVTVNGHAFDTSGGNWFQMDRISVFSSGPGQSVEDSRAYFLSLIGETPL